MAKIDVSINGRTYQIACDDGQESHLAQLGEYVDKRVRELVAAVGQVGDSRLLVMVALLIADELAETYAELNRVREQASDAAAKPSYEEIESRLADVIDSAAARIEVLAGEMAEEV